MSERFPAARKQHKCIWCGETIFPGEHYRREKSIFDGHWQDHCWHTECDEATKEYFDGGDDTFAPYDNERPVVASQEYETEKFLDDRDRAKDQNSQR